MKKYDFTIHTQSGNRIFFYRLSADWYELMRNWLDHRTDKLTLPYTNPNYSYAKPTTYYFGPAANFVEFYEVSESA